MQASGPKTACVQQVEDATGSPGSAVRNDLHGNIICAGALELSNLHLHRCDCHHMPLPKHATPLQPQSKRDTMCVHEGPAACTQLHRPMPHNEMSEHQLTDTPLRCQASAARAPA